MANRCYAPGMASSELRAGLVRIVWRKRPQAALAHSLQNLEPLFLFALAKFGPFIENREEPGIVMVRGSHGARVRSTIRTRPERLMLLLGKTACGARIGCEGLTFGHGLSFYRTGVVKFTLISSPKLLKPPATACVRTRISASCIA